MSYIVLLLTVGVTIYALVDCWRSTDDEVRGLPRPAWIIIIVLFWLLGGMAYLFFGRSRGPATAVGRPRVLAPDDDPEFLGLLDAQRRKAAADERRTRELQERRERKDRDRQERQQRKEQRKTGEPKPTSPSPDASDGDDHSGHPTA